jgi:hypothetical protein
MANAPCRVRIRHSLYRLAAEIERFLDQAGLEAKDVLPVMQEHGVDAVTAAVMVLEAKELVRLSGLN